MPGKRYTLEQIINSLRESEALMSQGSPGKTAILNHSPELKLLSHK